LKKENFLVSQDGWKSPTRQRQFFDEFAKSKLFDPSDINKWHLVTRKDISNAGGRGILKYHKDSLIAALRKLYPELNFAVAKNKHITEEG